MAVNANSVDYVANPNVYGTGADSTIGSQARTDHFIKKALVESRRSQYFMPLADVTAMPKNMGKTLKKNLYLPLLSGLNTATEGLDTAGNKVAGNLYASSKDVGEIRAKLPTLGENGGRVNKVGFTRVELTGNIAKYGIFDEYTEDSLQFDTDSELLMHINREMVTGATEITEDLLQADLLDNAGTIHLCGDETVVSVATLNNTSVVTYEDFVKFGITLDQNRTPRQTKIITGTRLTDTRTVGATRVIYCGSELIPTLKALKDYHGAPAFIEVQKYAANTTVLNGEIGAIEGFRIVVPPEMQHWGAVGKATQGTDAASGDFGAGDEYYGDGTNYDVFPLLCVGEESFSTIGFQTDGKSVKFKIIHKKPGEDTAGRLDPYGETGFMSIKWWYGFMPQRTERLAVMKATVKM